MATPRPQPEKYNGWTITREYAHDDLWFAVGYVTEGRLQNVEVCLGPLPTAEAVKQKIDAEWAGAEVWS